MAKCGACDLIGTIAHTLLLNFKKGNYFPFKVPVNASSRLAALR